MRKPSGFFVVGLVLAMGGCSDDGGGGGGDETTSGTGSDTTGGDTGSTGSDDTTTGGTSGTTESSGSGTDTTTTTEGVGEDSRVVFCADLDTPDLMEIFAVDYVDGEPGEPGDEVKVNHELAEGSNVNNVIQIAKDARRLAYLSWTPDPEDMDLYVVDVGGPTIGAAVKVSVDPAPDPGIANAVQFSPTGDKLAFRAGPAMAGPFDLYVSDVEGGDSTPTRVNPQVAPGGNVDAYAFSPDGSLFVYVADLDGADVFNVYVQNADPADPGSPIPMTDNVVAGIEYEASWMPDSQRIVYLTDDDGDSAAEVFVADVGDPGGTPIRHDPAGGGEFRHYGFTPDLGAYVYGAGAGWAGNLWLATFDGSAFGAPVRVNSIGPGGDVSLHYEDVVLFPDSSRLAYLATHDDPAVQEAWVAELVDGSPGEPVKANGTLDAAGNVEAIAASPTGAWLYYFAGQDAPEVALYRAEALDDGVGTPMRLHEAGAGSLSAEIVLREEAQLLFTGDLDEVDRQELYHADLGEDPPVTGKVNEGGAGAETHEVAYGALFSESGRHIVYGLIDLDDPIGGQRPILLVDLDREGLGHRNIISVDSSYSKALAVFPLE